MINNYLIKKRKRLKIFDDINITPMVDVMLVLLIIFALRIARLPCTVVLLTLGVNLSENHGGEEVLIPLN